MGSGETYVKIAWNPVFLDCGLSKTTPQFGIKIECPDGGCNGLPCSIDPSTGGVGGLDSPVATSGVGGASFCVVTVPKGKSANIVVFNTDGSSDTPVSSSKPEPTSTKVSSVEKPTSSAPPTSSSAAPPPSSSSSSSSSSEVKSSAVSSAAPSTTSEIFVGGIFQEQDVQGSTVYYSKTPTVTPKPVATEAAEAVTPVPTTSKNEGMAAEGGSAIAGLVVALIAAAALF